MAVIYGASALSGLRQDLGHVSGRWWEEYSGLMSRYVAMACTIPHRTNRSGRISIPRQDWVRDRTLIDQRYRRLPYEATPRGRHGSMLVLDIDPVQYGQAMPWDDTDELIIEMLDDPSVGQAGVTEMFLQAAMARLGQGTTFDFLALLSTAAGPFQDGDQVALADIDASAKPWSDPTDSTPIAHFADAIGLVGRELNAALMTFKTANRLFQSAELTGRYGGNQGAGPLSPQLRAEVIKNLGVEYLFLTDDQPYYAADGTTIVDAPLGLTGPVGAPVAGRYAILFQFYPGTSKLGLFGPPATFYRAFMPIPGADENGVAVSTRDTDHNIHEVYPSGKFSWLIDPNLGARIDFGAPA